MELTKTDGVRNIRMSVKDHTLVVKIDLTEDLGKSSSGRTNLVAKGSPQFTHEGQTYGLNLNLWRRPTATTSTSASPETRVVTGDDDRVASLEAKLNTLLEALSSGGVKLPQRKRARAKSDA